MAGRRLEYEITTDASKGIAGLKQFATAAKKSMGQIDDSLDDTTTSAQKLAKVLGGMADDLEQELKQAGRAADALAASLGPELASRADVGSLVSDLQRMGLTFDEITADADVLAASLKRMDDVQLSGLNRGLGNVETSMGKVRSSSDQTGSVMANMAGNTAQDMGALVGVTGTLGVTMGQLAEYATEGNVGLAQFAKLAGPMAAVGVAAAVAAKYFKAIADTKAFEDNRVRDFVDALDDAAVTAKELQDILATEEDPNSMMARIGNQTRDVEDNVKRVMGSFEEFNRVVGGGEEEFKRWIANQLAVAAASGATEEELVNLNDALLAGLRSTRANTKVALALGDGYEDLVFTAFAAGAAIRQQGDATAENTRDNEFYGKSLDATADALERSEGAHERNMFRLKAHRDEMRESAEAAADYAVQLLEAQAALDEMASPTANLERSVDAMTQAFDLKNAPLDALNETKDFEEGLRDLVKFIKGDLKGVVPDIFDVNDINAKPMLDKIAGLRGTVQQRISEAFASGGPGAAQATADAYVKQFVDSLDGKISASDIETLWGIDELQASIKVAVDAKSLAEAQILLDILTGITGGTAAEKIWLAQVKLDLAAGKLTPQAAQKLIADQLGEEGLTVDASVVPNTADAIAGAQRFIDAHGDLDIPTSVENPSDASVIAARNSAQNTLNRYPATLPVVPFLDTRKVTAQARAFRSFFEGMDTGGTASGFGGIAGERGPEILNRRYLTTGPTYVPPGTKVTSRRQTARILRTRGTAGLRRYDAGGTVSGPRTVNINVSAGVIGNRYDVNRAFRKAMYENARLLGVRP